MSKKPSFKESVLKQIETCQSFFNHAKGSVTTKLIDHIFVQNNLYLVMEAYDISLIEHLPFLIKENQSNELVSIMVVHDTLKMQRTFGPVENIWYNR